MTTLLKKTTAGLALALGVMACGTADAAYTTVPTINEAGGGGFWDNTSTDGPQRNVGYFLSKTGAFAPGGDGDAIDPETGYAYNHFSPNIALGNLQFLDSSGFSLNDSSGTQILLELASFRPTNQLWVWEQGAAAPTLVFDGSDQTGDTGLISVSASAQLVLVETNLNRAFFSGGLAYDYAGADATWFQNLGAATAKTNFAAFVDATGVAGDGDPNTQDVWVGIEDNLDGDNDYNDMIIRLHFNDPGDNLDPNAVPAPPALVLALAGVLPCLALRRRFRAQAV